MNNSDESGNRVHSHIFTLYNSNFGCRVSVQDQRWRSHHDQSQKAQNHEFLGQADAMHKRHFDSYQRNASSEQVGAAEPIWVLPMLLTVSSARHHIQNQRHFAATQDAGTRYTAQRLNSAQWLDNGLLLTQQNLNLNAVLATV